MTKNILIILSLFLSLSSCSDNNDKISDSFKEGLISFNVRKSNFTNHLEDHTLNANMKNLWTDLSKFNCRNNKDTLIVDVNTYLSTTLNYDGGYDIIHNKLILLSKNMDSIPLNDSIHATLTYKILLKGQTIENIDYREIKNQ